MKINSLSYKIAGLVITLAIPFSLHSIINTAHAQTLLDTTAATGIGTAADGGPAINPTSIRKKIRADLEAKTQNAKINQETRNVQLEKRNMMATGTPPKTMKLPQPPKNANLQKRASTTPLFNREGKSMIDVEGRPILKCPPGTKCGPEINGENRPLINSDDKRGPNASSTLMRRDSQENDKGPMKLGLFKKKKENAAKQFEVAIHNLKNLRQRIVSRIEKEQQNGRDMSKAKQLMTIADTKFAELKTAIDALRAYSPVRVTDCADQPNSTDSTNTEKKKKDCIQTQVTASTTVNLDIARKLMTDAQGSIKDTHKALNDVIVEIAHSMGLKLGNENLTKTAPATTSPVVSPVSSMVQTVSTTPAPSSITQ